MNETSVSGIFRNSLIRTRMGCKGQELRNGLQGRVLVRVRGLNYKLKTSTWQTMPLPSPLLKMPLDSVASVTSLDTVGKHSNYWEQYSHNTSTRAVCILYTIDNELGNADTCERYILSKSLHHINTFTNTSTAVSRWFYQSLSYNWAAKYIRAYISVVPPSFWSRGLLVVAVQNKFGHVECLVQYGVVT